MEKNTETKTNRYTILDAEVKAISKALKSEKLKMLAAIKDAEAAYRKYRKETYAPARKAAFDKFKAAKTVAKKPKTETAKKPVVQKKVAGVGKTAAECIAKGEAVVEPAKAAAKAK